MKILRLFDSLKFVRAMFVAAACVFILNVAHAATLPAGYTELEYLESTGEQYVELSFGFDPTDMIQADLSVNIEEYTDKYMVAPKVWNSNHNKFAMGVHMGVYTIAYQDITTSDTRLIPSKRNDGQIHKWIYGGYVFSIPELNTSMDVSGRTFGTTTSNIRLFYGYQGGTKGKISYYKHVKANGTSVELIPARRNSDGVVGMYDTVSGQFFTNAGTGEFIAGEYKIKIATTHYNETKFAPVETRLDAAVAAVDTVVSQTMTQAQAIDQIANEKQTRPDEGCSAKYCLLVEDEDGTPHWYPIVGANDVAHNLPAGYTELQFIIFNGNQFLDTGYTPNQGTRIESKFYGTTDLSWIYGTGISAPRITAYLAKTGNQRFGNLTVANTNISANTLITLVQDKGMFNWNGNVKSYGSQNNFTALNTLTIGISNGSTGGTPSFSGDFYYMKIYENDTMVRNLIPAKRNNDNVVGMYDMVSGQFFTNAGTGEFTAGPDM